MLQHGTFNKKKRVFFNIYRITNSYGTWSNGVANAQSICAAGYEVCPSANRTLELGLTATECQNVRFNNIFFATLESSGKYNFFYDHTV